jgi:hypothetical protein
MQLSCDFFRDLDVQLAGLFFHDPAMLQCHEKQFPHANFRGNLAKMLKAKLAQAPLKVSQANILAVPALKRILEVEHIYTPFEH